MYGNSKIKRMKHSKYERTNEWNIHVLYTYPRYTCARELELVHLCVGFVDVNNWTSMWVDSFSLTYDAHCISYIWNDYKVSMYLYMCTWFLLLLLLHVLDEFTKCLCWLWRYSELLALKNIWNLTTHSQHTS